jgi:UDP-N-acetylmuramate--alanine ligase
MSGLASILLAQGKEISGSDLKWSPDAERLRKLGIPIHVGHAREHISRELDGVIVSSAIPSDNVEVAAARDLQVPVVRRLHAVASLLEGYSSIGVVGSHGKSTTTAMTATLLRELGLSPSYLVGAHCPNLGGNAHLGNGAWFVAEVDESDGLFTEIRPTIAVLTNVGKDHLQTYRSEAAIREAFRRYVLQAGRAVLAIDDAQVRDIAREVPNAITVGLCADAQVRAADVQQEKLRTTFELFVRGRSLGRRWISAPGTHNVRNVLCALGAAMAAGESAAAAADTLDKVMLPRRRFEILEENGVTVVDDFAHTPEEVEATLRAIRQGWAGRRIVAVFQPHRYTRTQSMGSDFGRAFSDADIVIVTNIYSACEHPMPGVSSEGIVDAVVETTDSAVYSIPKKEDVVSLLKTLIRPGDFIISFGAGDIWTVTEELAHFLKEGSFCVA